MNRGGTVEAKTPLKDGGNAMELGRATKSGRKVKRPAHFDDSPDAKKSASNVVAVAEEVSPTKRKEVVPEVAKKSARKTILKVSAEEDTSPKRNGEPAVEVTKKSARKTLAKMESREDEPEPVQRSSRKTMTVVARDESSPEPEGVKKSARKALLKSAVKKASEQTLDTPKKGDKPEVESPPKKSAKKPEVVEEEAPAGPGLSRTGRKIKIPAHLKEFEDVVVPSPKKEVPEKPAARKSLAPAAAAAKKEEVAPKTPGRARSLAAPRKAPEPEPKEVKVEPKTPRRGKSQASIEVVEDDDPLAVPTSPQEVKSPKKERQVAKSPVKAPKPVADPIKDEELPAKTPRRGKSLAAPELTKSSPPVQEDKPPAKTPSKRGKSMAAAPAAPSSPPAEKPPKTPKTAAAKLAEESSSSEPISRSGRKIKPKKYFGEYEEDEPTPAPVVPAKMASPVKSVAKSSSPQAAKKVASPVKASVRQSPTVFKKESPAQQPKRASPVKRQLVVAAAEKTMELPKKKAKLDPKVGDSEGPKKAEDISPNTEERLITKRGVNDHHHHHAGKEETSSVEAAEETAKPPSTDDKKEEPEKVEKAPTEEDKPKRGRKTLAAKAEETPVVEESKPTDQPEKPKRGRKTLPAPAPVASSDEGDEPAPAPKAPKTPVARRMTTASLAPATVEAEDAGSSRSGRKIKPKKFFGEDEPVSAAKPKTPAPVNGAGSTGGRGRRKTLAAELDKASSDSEVKEDKTEEVVAVAPQAQTEVEKCPSREEILAVVGVVDPVDQPQEEAKMEVDEQTISKDEEEQEEKHVEEQTPMEEDLPQEQSEPEPITTPVVGTAPEEAVTEEAAQAADEPESIADSEPVANDDEEVPPTTEAADPVEEDQIESVDPDDVNDEEADPVVAAEDDESTLQEPETVQSGTQEDFQETSIPQTSPRPDVTTEVTTTTTEEVPKSPAPLPEEPPVPAVEEQSEPAETAEVIDELDDAPEAAEIAEEPEQVEEEQEEAVAEVSEAQVENPEEVEQEEVVAEVSEAPVENPEEEVDGMELQASNVEADQEPLAATPAVELQQQPGEASASSSFSEALLVADESAERVGAEEAKVDDSRDQQYESVEFLEMSGASTTAATEPATIEQLPVEETNGHQDQEEQKEQNRITTPDLDDDLDDTEAPPMDDLDDEKEDELLADELLEDEPEPKEVTFSERDRDNESIIVIPDTPKPPKSEFDEEFDLGDKSPVPQSSSQTTVGRVELPLSPVMKQEMVPTTPRTPDSKPATQSSCSPDKPDDQDQQADVPHHEIIDITDSPIAVLDPKLHQTDGKPGSTTSTPLRMGSKMTTKDRLIANSRKRSLSASDAEIVKKNVTFHSPANSTMLVDTIDERLKKKNESATKPSQAHRKRSMSEHKDAQQQDGPKPSKISKLPNFKNIHQQQFNRMESIEEFHNRKVQRAKEILASSAVKSPAASALVRSAERPPLQKSSSVPSKSPYKSGNGAASSSTYYQSSSKPAVVRPLIPKSSSSSESHHKPLSDAERQEKRQKQFQATFKSKSQDGSGAASSAGSSAASSNKDTPDGAHRVIEQSRHKQSQILKGVRTNKRFELMMKYRDAHE